MDLLTTTIDLDAIAHNTRVLKKLAGTAQLMCVVKADGYNHGAVETAQVMAHNGADQFGVATLAEAQQLLDGGIDKPILAWMWRPEQTL
ncbi:alanine racemase, partial [Corynebacterium durum]|uniref:alanine racemase n=1 Tax=Corynebacterium durum TaxID=61592 RepID=UPI003899E136